jgi:ParB family transcriptional regulator, chromosome partitioning protein
VAEPARGMGRGLAAILTVAPREEGDELRAIPVDRVVPNPSQPRVRFDEEGLAALAGSISARGVLQPVLVRPLPSGKYELIAGERRWRAAQLAGLDEVPAMIRARGDAESLELALIENMARENLNPIEEARACAALVEELGLTREEVGVRVGRSRVAVSNLLRLLDLPDEALELIELGGLTEGHGRALLIAPEHDERRRLAREAASEAWSVRELERRARPARPLAKRSSPRPAHPDLEASLTRVADALTSAFGAEVRVTPRGEGCRVQLAFDSLEDALELAERLGADVSV